MADAVRTTGTGSAADHLHLLMQYTMEAYKTFQKLAELLPNPITASMFANFAKEEREARDLLEIKYSQSEMSPVTVTLGGDLRFQDILEGDLSYRETAEFLIGREKTMLRKLEEVRKEAGPADVNLFRYIAATKRAHLALLDRELQMTQLYPDWFKREDAEAVVVLGEEGARLLETSPPKIRAGAGR